MTNKDPYIVVGSSHLYEDLQGQNDALRAEVERLTQAVAGYENGITWETTCLKCAETIDKMAGVHLEALAQRDELRAEVERLTRERDALRADLERLRKIEVAANAWADVIERSEEGEGEEEFEDAGHTLFHALGRTTCTSCQT